MNIAVKRWIITCIPIYVNVLQEGCKQWAQYLTKVQLICSFSSLASRENKKKTYEILRFRSYVLKKIISSFGRYNGRQTDGQYDRQDKKHYASDIQKVCVWGGGGIKLNHIHRLADVLKINQIPVQLQSSFQLKLPNQIYFWLNSILYSCRRISNLGDFSVTGKCHRPNTSS